MSKSSDFDHFTFTPFNSGTTKLNKKVPTVSVRKAGIAFNQAFLDIALEHGPGGEYWVDVQADWEQQCLGLKFYHEAQRAMLVETDWGLVQRLYQLTGDGGKTQRKSRNKAARRSAGCGKIINTTPWLKSVALLPCQQDRRFHPVWSARHKLWAVHIGAQMQQRPEALFPIPAQAVRR